MPENKNEKKPSFSFHDYMDRFTLATIVTVTGIAVAVVLRRALLKVFALEWQNCPWHYLEGLKSVAHRPCSSCIDRCGKTECKKDGREP